VLQGNIQQQTYLPRNILIIDSSSDDGFGENLEEIGFSLIQIQRADFNHGGTRQLGVDKFPTAKIIIFLTQDSIPAHATAFDKLLSKFEDPKVGIVYGRQLPRQKAGPIEAHSRHYNYPSESRVRELKDSSDLGIRAAFCSNSFAAYRRTALEAVGGFQENAIFGEDMLVTAKMLKQGWKVAYAADAQVYHSHPYGFRDEFRRSFDIGVFHTQESWLLEQFGKAEGEGLQFVRSEIRYLLKNNKSLLPSALARNFLKYAGYRLGREFKWLPRSIRQQFSMNSGYWR